ncbi:MAG TPA: DNA translocase FtsK 4TM domain-containing protein, partial [Nitrospiraceae bacterium]|nr:DNA translocase FtsK 4TM domain-containing protein [Nitrospiraceae bacterium]
MGASTTAKRGDARSASRQPSHLKHEVIGVVLLTFGLLSLLSLISFSPTDVPLFGASPSKAVPTRNMIGTMGASLAASLFWLIGAGAYLLPFLLVMLGLRCFVEGALSVTLRSAAGSLAALIFLSALLHLELIGVPTLSSGFVLRGAAGGAVGAFIADGLRGYFASTGAHILVLAGLIVSLLLATPMSLSELWRRVPEWWRLLAETTEALIPERSERTEKIKKPKPRPVKIHRSAAGEAEPDMNGDPALAVAELPPHVPAISLQAKRAAEAVADNADTIEIEIPPPRPVSPAYKLPNPYDLLSDPLGPAGRMSDEALKAQSEILTRALLSFGIEGKVTEIHPGPVVTMYEFEPAPGVKVARIVSLSDDLALALKATALRIVAPLPGKSVVGVEVPNLFRETVSLKEVLTSDAYTRSRSKLTLALGKDIF